MGLVRFCVCLAFFILEALLVVLQLDEDKCESGLTLIALGGWIYWLICVHRLHKILDELTTGRYPISPAEAAGKHFIPFYNFYWFFKWPMEMSRYLNGRDRVRMISGSLIGLSLRSPPYSG